VIAFEYIFAPDDGGGEGDAAPQAIYASTIHDAIQILFLQDLRARGVSGTVRVRRYRSRDRWIVQRYVPPPQ
jgi:hypothetical protein